MRPDRLIFGFATFAFTILLSMPTYAQDDLEANLDRVAREMVKKLRSEGIESIDVLKFAVKIGSGGFPPNIGNLNVRLAQKLELALVLANPASKKKVDQQVVVARNATEVASKIKDASHLTSKGRELLFSQL